MLRLVAKAQSSSLMGHSLALASSEAPAAAARARRQLRTVTGLGYRHSQLIVEPVGLPDDAAASHGDGNGDCRTRISLSLGRRTQSLPGVSEPLRLTEAFRSWRPSRSPAVPPCHSQVTCKTVGTVVTRLAAVGRRGLRPRRRTLSPGSARWFVLCQWSGRDPGPRQAPRQHRLGRCPDPAGPGTPPGLRTLQMIPESTTASNISRSAFEAFAFCTSRITLLQDIAQLPALETCVCMFQHIALPTHI